jgi:hypothetical protein
MGPMLYSSGPYPGPDPPHRDCYRQWRLRVDSGICIARTQLACLWNSTWKSSVQTWIKSNVVQCTTVVPNATFGSTLLLTRGDYKFVGRAAPKLSLPVSRLGDWLVWAGKSRRSVPLTGTQVTSQVAHSSSQLGKAGPSEAGASSHKTSALAAKGSRSNNTRRNKFPS